MKLTDPSRPAQADVVVKGGEAFQLWVVDEDPRQVIHHRYDKELRDSRDGVAAPSDAMGRSFFIGVHIPQWVPRSEWKRPGARFYLSVQNSDSRQFSPRPAEAWVQIKPIFPPTHAETRTDENTGEETVYSFHDVRYEPGYPVPMLSCLVPNWPKEAKTALVQLCCKLEKTDPDKTVRIGDFSPAEFRIGGVPEVTFQFHRDPSADLRQVTIIERGPIRGDHYPIRVETSPAAEKVTRRFHFNPSTETKTVRHTFVFQEATASEIKNYEVLFTTGERMIEGAIVTPGPLQVTLPRE